MFDQKYTKGALVCMTYAGRQPVSMMSSSLIVRISKATGKPLRLFQTEKFLIPPPALASKVSNGVIRMG